VSLSLDPGLVRAVDSYVDAHQGADRSKVVDIALQVWTATQQEAAMEAQFSPEPGGDGELASWRQVRRAAAARSLGRD